MKKADFRFPDAQISGSRVWLKYLLVVGVSIITSSSFVFGQDQESLDQNKASHLLVVGVSIITSSSFVFGQDQESLAEQGFASHPFSEGRNAREATRTLYPACVQPCWDIRE